MSIGSDPEFGFLSAKTKRQIRATEVLPYDRGNLIGVDGHPHIAELRPPYKLNPLAHLEGIKRMMYVVQSLVRSHEDRVEMGVDTIAGSMVEDDPIGGHIHFGRKDKELPHYLDYYLLPIVAALDHKKPHQRRANRGHRFGGYGRFSDWRKKKYGFEYRSPASWLSSESIARGVLTCAWMIGAYKGHFPQEQFAQFDSNSYYQYKYEELRKAALFSLDWILKFAALHGRKAFLSVCTLKGLIKLRKHQHKGDIFSRWNFPQEDILPPLLTISPTDDPILLGLFEEFPRRYFAFPIHVERGTEWTSTIKFFIDPSIASMISSEQFQKRVMSSYSVAETSLVVRTKVEPSGGGVRVVISRAGIPGNVLTTIIRGIERTTRFDRADSDNMDIGEDSSWD